MSWAKGISDGAGDLFMDGSGACGSIGRCRSSESLGDERGEDEGWGLEVHFAGLGFL